MIPRKPKITMYPPSVDEFEVQCNYRYNVDCGHDECSNTVTISLVTCLGCVIIMK